MDEFPRQLAALLGLAETASQEEIFTAVKSLKDGGPASSEAANSEGKAGGGSLPVAEEKVLEAVADLVNAAESAAGAEEAAQKTGAPGGGKA